MKRVEKNYEEFLRLLKKHDVRYCIVGAYAFAYHAIARYPKILDIFVEPQEDNVRRLLRTIEEFGFTGLTEKDFITPGVIIQLGYEPVRIALVASIDGCTFCIHMSLEKLHQSFFHLLGITYFLRRLFPVGFLDPQRNDTLVSKGILHQQTSFSLLLIESIHRKCEENLKSLFS